jgi:hypothetical protein
MEDVSYFAVTALAGRLTWSSKQVDEHVMATCPRIQRAGWSPLAAPERVRAV